MRERYDNWTDGDGGDDSGFWNDEPTSRLERITQSIPRITQALPKLGQAFHRHHDEWDFRAEEPPAAPSTPRVYDQTEFDDLDEFDGYDAYSGRDGFNLRPAPMRSVARPTGPAVRRIPRTDDTSPTARLNVRRPATPPRPAGSRQHTGSIPRVTEDAPPRASAPAATTPRDVTGGVRRPQVTEADVVHTGSGTRATLANGLQHVDPLLRRVGALALVIALCIPVALGLRSGGDTASTEPVFALVEEVLTGGSTHDITVVRNGFLETLQNIASHRDVPVTGSQFLPLLGPHATAEWHALNETWLLAAADRPAGGAVSVDDYLGVSDPDLRRHLQANRRELTDGRMIGVSDVLAYEQREAAGLRSATMRMRRITVIAACLCVALVIIVLALS